MKVLKSRLADWLITQLSSNALFGRNKWLFHSLLLPPAWWRNEKLSWITRLIPCFFFFFFPMLYYNHRQYRRHTSVLICLPRDISLPFSDCFPEEHFHFSTFSHHCSLPGFSVATWDAVMLVVHWQEAPFQKATRDFSPKEDGVVVVILRLL